MLRIRAIVLGMLTVATSMAAEGGLLGAGIGAGLYNPRNREVIK